MSRRHHTLLIFMIAIAAACSAPATSSLDRFAIGTNGDEAPGGPFASTMLGVDLERGDVAWSLDVPWTPFGLLLETDVGFVIPYPGPPGDVGEPGDQVPAGLVAIGLDGRPLWQVDLPGAPQSIAELDGDVLVASHERALGEARLVPTGRSLLVRVDGRTGLPVWQRTLDFLVGPIVVLAGEIVMTDPGDLFVGIDPATGTERWSVPTRGRFDGGPNGKVVDDGQTAYFLVTEPVDGPTVLGVANGAAQGWVVPDAEFLVSASPDVVVVSRDSNGDGLVTGFDPQSRQELWSVPGGATSDFAGAELIVLAAPSTQELTGVSPDTGLLAWAAQAPDRLDAAVFDEGRAITAQADAFGRYSLTAYGADRAFGPLWRSAVPGAVYATPRVVGSVVVAGGDVAGPGADAEQAGWLGSFGLDDGVLRWQIDPGAEPAAIAAVGGMLYVMTHGAVPPP